MSAHEFINPQQLMPADGFSHVVVPAPGRTIYIAGQTAHQADGWLRGATIAEQADAALANLVVALAAAGARPADLVTLQIYVTDVHAYRARLDEIGPSWQRHLGKHFPAVALFGVAALYDDGALIEIVATAVIPD